MAKRTFKAGATSQTMDIFIQDSSSTTGAGLSGLVYNAAGLTAYYRKGATGTATAITLATQTVGGAFSSGGFVEIDSVHMKGMYRFDIPDTILASTPEAIIFFYGATNMAPVVAELEIITPDPFSANFGMTNVSANVAQINSVSTSSVTTVNANIGLTQPLNFTGTGASALAKSDMVDIAGAAVSTSSAQIGVNAVNWAGGAIPAVNVTGVPLVDLKYTLGTISPATAGSVRADAVTGAVGSVTGAVGSVTGSVGSVTGSVGSVTGAVGSVTGNVGGNVTGSVGSIASGGITRASYAADTGHQTIRSNTAAGGGATTITLDASASATNSFYNNCIIYITGGTGVGQARFITAYVGATKVATVSAWATNPDNTSTFAIIPFDSIPGASAPTAAQVATAVWQDTFAGGDFGTAGSVGALLNQTGGGFLKVDVEAFGGTAGTFASGRPEVNTTHAAGTAWGSGAITSGSLSAAGKNAIADSILDRDMSTGTDSGSPSVRTVRQALRFLRNKWTNSGGTLTVYKEDDTTSSWTGSVSTDAAALPITGNDPA